MKKPPKKPHYIRPPFEPQWEDEPDDKNEAEVKNKAEEDAALFKKAVESSPIPSKDDEHEKKLSKVSTRGVQNKSNGEKFSIDLHGLTVAEAQDYVVVAIEKILNDARGKQVDIRIITGKGNHSRGGKPQLISSIHHVVEQKFRHRIISIEASPHELHFGNSYWKGHFDVRLK